MKSRKLWLGMLVIALVLGMILIGCSEPEESPTTYTVWTDTVSYSEYSNVFGTLNDGYYVRYEFTSSEWSSISPSLTNEGKHQWTEDQIYNYFIGRGFDQAIANKEKAWLLSINHGFLAARDRSLVYMILK